MPHAPPSPAVSMTVTGALTAAARIFCPTSFVLNRPPWPIRRSICTPSSFRRMSRPVFSAPKEVNRCTRMKFARLKRLSGFLTKSGRPSSKPVICSPEK